MVLFSLENTNKKNIFIVFQDMIIEMMSDFFKEILSLYLSEIIMKLNTNNQIMNEQNVTLIEKLHLINEISI